MPVTIATKPTFAGLTVRNVIEAVFPKGYIDYSIYRSRLKNAADGKRNLVRRHTKLTNPPCSAVDLFAIAGSLLTRSGAYHHVSPEVPPLTPRSLTVKASDREAWVAAGSEWRGDGSAELPPPPQAVLDAWKIIRDHADEPIFRSAKYSESAHPWWWAALTRLPAIAMRSSGPSAPACSI